MTKELLDQANKIQNRINVVSALLNNIDLTDIADGIERTSPIIIGAGMAQTIQFDIKGNTGMRELDILDTQVFNMIHGVLKDYKKKLEENFQNLS